MGNAPIYCGRSLPSSVRPDLPVRRTRLYRMDVSAVKHREAQKKVAYLYRHEILKCAYPMLIGMPLAIDRIPEKEKIRERNCGLWRILHCPARNANGENAMSDKYLAKLGDGWITEEINKYRYNRPDGSFLRVIRFPKEWIVCNFGTDGNATHANSYSSFKKLLESLKEE
jgi:hypothetical protein